MAQNRATVELLFQMRDQAKREMRDLGKETRQTAREAGFLKSALSFATGALIVGGISKLGRTVSDFLRGSLDEAKEAQQGFSQLQNVILSTGGAAGLTADDVLKLTSRLSAAGGLSKATDDAVLSGANMLLTFTNIRNGVGETNQIFDRTTQLTLDMATAMKNGAQPSAEDLAGTAQKLGKALNDPTRGMSTLTRVGITFTEEQKNTIKSLQASGNLMGAQSIILDELSKKFGGSAAASVRTFEGSMIVLNQRLDDVKQSVGEALMPLMMKFAGFLGSDLVMGSLERVSLLLVSGVGKGIETVEGIVTRVRGPLGSFFGDIRDRAREAGDTISTVKGIVENQFWPALQKVLSGDTLGAMEQFKFGWGGIKNLFSDLTIDAGGLKTKIVNVITSTAQDARDQLPKIKVTLENIYDFSVTVGTGFVTTAQTNISKSFADVMDALKRETFPAFAQEFNREFPIAFNAALAGQGAASGGSGGSGWLDTAKFIGLLFPPARLAAVGLTVAEQQSPGFIGSFLAGLGDAFNDPAQVQTKTGSFIAGIQTWIQGAGDWIKDEGAPKLTAAASELGKGLFNWMTDRQTWETAARNLEGFKVAAGQLIQLALDKLKVDPADAKTGAQSALEGLAVRVDPDKWNWSFSESWNFFLDVLLPKVTRDVFDAPSKAGGEISNFWNSAWATLFGGMVGAQQADTSNLSQVFADFIISALKNLPEATGRLKEAAGTALAALFGGMFAAVDEVNVKIDMADFLMKAIAWDKISEIGRGILNNILGGMLTNDGQTGDRQAAVDRFFGILMIDFEDGSKAFAETLANLILTNIRTALKGLGASDDLINQFLPEKVELPPSMKDKLAAMGLEMSTVVAYAAKTDTSISDAITQLGEIARRKAENEFGKNGASSGAWQAAGAGAPALLGAGVAGGGKALSGTVATIGAGALAEAKKNFSSGSWKPLGESAGSGLVAGMRAWIGQAASAGVALANAAKSAVADTLESKSPSKVAERLGKWFGEGFSLGVEGQAPDTERRTIDVFAQLLTKLNNNGTVAGAAQQLGRSMWDQFYVGWAYSEEKGIYMLVEELDSRIVSAVKQTPLAGAKALARKLGEEVSQITTDPAIIGPMTRLGEDLWGIAAQGFVQNAETGAWEVATVLTDTIASAVARTDAAKLKESMKKFAGEGYEQFTSDPQMLAKLTNSGAREAAEKAMQADASRMISPLTSLAGAKMPTQEEIDAFFVAYERWLVEWNKRADLFAQTASLTTTATTQKMAGIGEAMSKIFDPILSATKVQEVDPGAIEGAMSNVWALLDQYNKVMGGGTAGTPFEGEWIQRAIQFATDIATIFTGVKTAFSVVGEAQDAATGTEGITGMFGAIKTSIIDLLDGPWGRLKGELTPTDPSSIVGLFRSAWLYADSNPDSLAKLHNTSLHAMNQAAAVVLAIYSGTWKTTSGNVVGYINDIIGAIGRLNGAVETMRLPGSTAPTGGNGTSGYNPFQIEAAGGYRGWVRGPTGILAGEGIEPEYVSITPRSKIGGMPWGGGGGVRIENLNVTAMPGVDAREFARAMADTLYEELRSVANARGSGW